jgi:SAM-dependent methyltransferase
MTASPLQDVVSKQYEEWVYPAPIQDLTSWVTDNWQWFDPSHAHSVLWPEREQKLDLDILIAGCGTNQAAVFAYTNPDSKVTAIDVSQTSLDHTEYLKKRHGLDNLETHRLPIEEVGTLGKTFDLIVSTGVLHHLADPQAGMNALAPLLREDGVMAIMLYATYGRQGVEMMQDIFRELELGQSSHSIAKVREAIAATPANHPVRSYLNIAPDLDFDAGAVDTFLHGRDCDYTIAQCVELVENGGLAFQDMFLRASYHPALGSEGSSFFRAVEELPREKIWGVMERINFANACHFFLATHPSRPSKNYVIDFSTTDSFRYVPSFRYRCGVNGSAVYRNNWSLNLNDSELAVVRLIDGKRSVGDILTEVSSRKKELGLDVSRVELERLIRRLFQGLWRNDYITVSTAAE